MRLGPIKRRTPSEDAENFARDERRLKDVEDKLPSDHTYHLKARTKYRAEFAETIYGEKKHNRALTRIFRGTTNDDKVFFRKIDDWVKAGPESERENRKDVGQDLTANVTRRNDWLYLNFAKSKFMPPDFLKEFTWLKSLVIRGCDYERLPDLPCSLLSLSVGSCNKLRGLPKLPIDLKELDVAYGGLETLPMLPPSLAELNVRGNRLVVLPELPGALSVLEAGQNRLSTLPHLSGGIVRLRVGGNQLVEVPQSIIDKKNRYAEWCFAGNPWSDKAEEFLIAKFGTLTTPDED